MLTTQDPEPLLEVKNLYVEYLVPFDSVKAVTGVSFNIYPGEVFGLAGESGCGKSTIAHTILRVLRPPAIITGGNIYYKGVDVLEMGEGELDKYRGKITDVQEQGATLPTYSLESFRWAEVAMVFQSAMNSLNPVVKIKSQITDVIMAHQKISKKQALARAEELMDFVNIEKQRLDAYPHELSGGMRQRAVIAITLALNPSLLIMDEPTTALDVVVQKDILQQIEQLQKRLGFSILFITHDLSLMVETSHRIGIMYAGEIVELARSEEIFNHALHPYTQGLLSSFPSITGPRKKLTGIPGAPPNLLKPPLGCRFHP
ncbi:MAG TPA: ABC transporter ATP-binding protein, partial [Anaerolineales bacterium]|nr:ABC transporter ATP-binding protein [Anaerolineales bacterium]